nr:hypothetical protein Iba_chr03eCG10340 [Ipomoea batatas]
MSSSSSSLELQLVVTESNCPVPTCSFAKWHSCSCTISIVLEELDSFDTAKGPDLLAGVLCLAGEELLNGVWHLEVVELPIGVISVPISLCLTSGTTSGAALFIHFPNKNPSFIDSECLKLGHCFDESFIWAGDSWQELLPFTTHFSASSHLEGKDFLEKLPTLKLKIGLPGVEGASTTPPLLVTELSPPPFFLWRTLLLSGPPLMAAAEGSDFTNSEVSFRLILQMGSGNESKNGFPWVSCVTKTPQQFTPRFQQKPTKNANFSLPFEMKKLEDPWMRVESI